MPLTLKGRPRLTDDDLRARVAAYCAQYGATPKAEGLPPFPAGRRETRQHREWISIYKLHNRLGRRRRGQCERCSSPASDGSVFCDTHRAGPADPGKCPICAKKVDLRDAVDHRHAGRSPPIVHPRCRQLVALAESAGLATLDRLRQYLSRKA